MQFLALLVTAFMSCGCQATGQTAGELFMPDTLQVFGSAGEGDFDGEWHGYHTRQFDGDFDSHALGVALGWNLTAADVQAQRDTARAVRELATRLDGLQLARAQVEPEPEKCGEPTPQEGQADHATLLPAGEDSQDEEPVDLEAVLYAVGGLVAALSAYFGRNRIPGVKGLRTRRAAKAAAKREQPGGDPPLC